MTRDRDPRAIDWGRVIAVPLLALALLGNGLAMPDLWPDEPLALASTTVVLMFYTVLIVQYLRRGPATGSDRRPLVWVVAVAGMLSPFAIVPLSTGDASFAMTLAGTVLTVFGLTGAIWALTHLGRNISVIPQAREVTVTGPYRLLRHPLYVFEWLAAAGLVLVSGGGSGWAVLAFAAVCLWLRAKWEERLLARELPAYREYLGRR